MCEHVRVDAQALAIALDGARAEAANARGPGAIAMVEHGIRRYLEAVASLRRDTEPDGEVIARWLLRNATLGLSEDADGLHAWFNLRPNDEQEHAFLTICYPSGDDGELTAEDAPFLTDAQRADINGSVPHAKGYVGDVDTILAAIRYAADLTVLPASAVPGGR